MPPLPKPQQISTADYNYALPPHQIASFPLPERDAAKLLVYRNHKIAATAFRQLPDLLPPFSQLVFNTTKVVAARLFFTKPTGASIEIFCLEPAPVYPDITTAMATNSAVQWICLVGGAAKWSAGLVLEKTISSADGFVTLTAAIANRNADHFTIDFSWSPATLTFADILQLFGVIPIPPYLNRPTADTDAARYQTIYAHEDGSVAAPTAGLHFTPAVFSALKEKQINSLFVTLHIGAGTFKPVKAPALQGHDMHAEFIDVQKETIVALMAAKNNLIAVGTTSLRTIESLYWMGVKAAVNPSHKLADLSIGQWEVYEDLISHALPVNEALKTLLERMEQESAQRLISKTKILIAPGYPFKMVQALITNFHQPQSTLLLLVAALVGPAWESIYRYALDNDFRFLSYGDSSLIFNHQV
jgi:S-adenosylmethionine:tRNA ribosyltransferase-isomerase